MSEAAINECPKRNSIRGTKGWEPTPELSIKFFTREPEPHRASMKGQSHEILTDFTDIYSR